MVLTSGLHGSKNLANRGNCTTKRGQVEAPLVTPSVINRLTKDKDDSPMTDILIVHVNEAFMAVLSPKGIEP